MSEKSKSTAFLLCYFLGVFGVHRFYIGRWKTAVLMLLTIGGLGIWWLIDTVLIMGAKLTDADGNALRTGPPNPDDTHAGFWVRFAAISVDMIIINLLLVVVSFIGSIALGLGSMATLDMEDPVAIQQFGSAVSALSLLLFVVVVPLYFGLQTASSHQATIGKRIFDIHVCTKSDGKPSVLRGLWRAVCYGVSAVPVGLGFLLGAFTKDKRALHDYLAGTKVMYATASVGTAPRPESQPASESPVTRSSAATVERGGTDTSGKALIAMGTLLLAGAAALALL